LQNKALRACSNYNKTETNILYCKSRIFKIPDLFKTIICQIYLFDNFEHPKHFGKCISAQSSNKACFFAKMSFTQNAAISE